MLGLFELPRCDRTIVALSEARITKILCSPCCFDQRMALSVRGLDESTQLLLENLFLGVCDRIRGDDSCSNTCTIICNSLYLALDALRMRPGTRREIGHEEAEIFGPPDIADEGLRYASPSEPHQVLGPLTVAHASLTFTRLQLRETTVWPLPDPAAPHAHFGRITGTSRPRQVRLRANNATPAFGVLSATFLMFQYGAHGSSSTQK